MELENLVKLIQTVSDSDLTGFQYEENGVKLKIQKEKEQMVVSTGAAQLTTVQNVPGAQSNAVSALKSEDGPEKGKEAEGQLIKSPLVGTFYAAPSEEAAPFVAVGDHVAKGQTVAIGSTREKWRNCGIRTAVIPNRIAGWRAKSMKHLGIKEIQKIIPHRHPFLLVDYIEDYEPGEYAVGYKCVTYREDFFAGHFPQEPVMPGVLIVEALAQVGAVAVLMQEENKGKLGYFGGIKNCKFRRKVVPGDKLKLEAKIIRQKGPLVIGEAVASVDGEVAVKAELSLMIGKAETDD